jgi:DNA-directed RNA polymerase subunit beta
LAASRPAKTSRTSSNYAPRRISFGRITEQLEVPNLLAIQTESFDWLVGNEAWQARSTDDPHAHSGLAEILEEISPIEDFSAGVFANIVRRTASVLRSSCQFQGGN